MYWCGPLLGGLAAGLLYDNVFASNASFTKAKDYLLASKFKNEEYAENKEPRLVVTNEEEEEGV